MFDEQPVSFKSANKQLSGILHPGIDDATTGVLVVVGGPQYRVGSHRQFVHLARALAEQGIPVLRFDVTGMGDSEGDKKPFEHLDDDIRAALDCFFQAVQGLKNVVLWGLCDGASAALLYAPKDIRVHGLVLVNPWLENSITQAQTKLWDYYLKRLFNPTFWKKFFYGGVDLRASVGELGATVSSVAQSSKQDCLTSEDYQQRMLGAFQRLDASVLLLLSGEDLTAREFERQFNNHKDWKKARQRKKVELQANSKADHTFSSREWKDWASEHSCRFVRSL